MEHLVLLAKPETKSVPGLARVPPIAREETSLVPLVSKKLGREKSLAAPKEQVPVRRIRVALLEWWPLVSSHDSDGGVLGKESLSVERITRPPSHSATHRLNSTRDHGCF